MFALEVNGLCKEFGALKVTTDVSLNLKPGARSALIGPNGAGKTTLINLITGALKPSAGHIKLYGQDITQMSQAERVRMGLVRTFQITRLFKSLTVADNLRMAILQRPEQRMSFIKSVNSMLDLDAEVHHMLQALSLESRYASKVADLAYGEQRLVELGLALSMRPKVLLLDEPAAGVPQSETDVIVNAIQKLPSDLAVLLIEHDMDLVFKLTNDITVLVSGSILMNGSPQEVANDDRVRNLYLGGA